MIYLITGIFLSLNAGISHDEYHEQLNWEINLKAIKNFYQTGYYKDLLEYKDRYHGIGFNFLSQPFQYLIKDFFVLLHLKLKKDIFDFFYFKLSDIE